MRHDEVVQEYYSQAKEVEKPYRPYVPHLERHKALESYPEVLQEKKSFNSVFPTSL